MAATFNTIFMFSAGAQLRLKHFAVISAATVGYNYALSLIYVAFGTKFAFQVYQLVTHTALALASVINLYYFEQIYRKLYALIQCLVVKNGNAYELSGA
jgi:hypothetical protein